MRQTVRGDVMALTVADRGVVNHGVEVAKRIDLGREIFGAGDGPDVADHDRLGLGQFLAHFVSPLGVAGVKHTDYVEELERIETQ